MARKIDPVVVKFLEEKLAGNGLYHAACKAGDARTIVIEAAKVCVGIKEKTGHNDGPLVEAFQRTSGGGKGQAWCLYFASAMVAFAESKTGKKSPLPVGGHCLTTWNKAPSDMKIKGTPMAGAIVLWRHGSTSSGHAGVIISAGDTTLNTVEGNSSGTTNKNGKIVREGNGVFANKRSRKGNGNMRILGYLNPFPG